VARGCGAIQGVSRFHGGWSVYSVGCVPILPCTGRADVKTVRIIGALIAPLAIAAVAAPVALAAPTPRVTLSADTVTGLEQAQSLGAVPADQHVSVAVSLNLRNGAELDRTIAAVNDPHSAQYGHFLTPAQFTARFGPTTDQVDRVTSYLRAQGLSVDG